MIAAALLAGLQLAATTTRATPGVEVSAVKTDEYGDRTVMVTAGDCRLRVWRARETMIRIQVEAGDCDPVIDPLRPGLERALSLLIDATPGSGPRLALSLYLPHQPSALRTWARFLRQSADWKQRPPLKAPWDTSEYPLVRKLLHESATFDSYHALLAKHGYRLTAVHIEKVAYPTTESLRRRGFDPGELGYAPGETLPVPLMIWLRFER